MALGDMLKSCGLVATPLDFDELETERCLASVPDEAMAAVLTFCDVPLSTAMSGQPVRCMRRARRFGSGRLSGVRPFSNAPGRGRRRTYRYQAVRKAPAPECLARTGDTS